MSHELVVSLIVLLKEEVRAFDGLHGAMARSRGAFVSVGARRLETGIQDLQAHARRIRDLESKRSTIADELRQQLGLEGSPQVSRIAPLLPDELGRSLRHAANAAAAAARRVRTECHVGTRLLRLSEQANTGIIESLLGLGDHHRNASYDHNARSQSTDMPGGSIISGTA